MAKNIVNRVNRNLARRLREARRELGLSTRAVAERLPRRLTVSHATLASYENGTTVPPVDVLAALADIYKRTLTWFLDNRETLSGFRYRNLNSRVRLGDQRHFEAVAGKWADAYLNLERHLNVRPESPGVEFDPLEPNLSPVLLAESLRKSFLNLEEHQPILNVVSVLELFPAKAIELRSALGIDAATARHGNQTIVVLNPDTANERLRLTTALEIARLFYDNYIQHQEVSEDAIETQAYFFATSLLMPNSQLKEAFNGKSFLKLIQFKERFGVPLTVMIYRAEQTRIINTTTARWLWSEIARRGWRAKEPGFVWRDRAISFETMLECALQTKQIAWQDAERITGIRESELRERLTSVMQLESASEDEHHDKTNVLVFQSPRDIELEKERV